MARKPTLSVVTARSRPVPAKKPMTLADAAESGTYLEILIAQRREMIREVPDVTGPAKAAMHRQIALHSKEIAALKTADEQEASEDGDVADEAFDASAL